MPQNYFYSKKISGQIVFKLNNLLKLFSLITFILVGSSNVIAQVKAIFTAVPDEGCKPLTINFQNFSENADSYIWDFGNGTSTDWNPTNIYNYDGTYEVTLIAINSVTHDTSIVKHDITVREAPGLSFEVSENSACVNEPLLFTYELTTGSPDEVGLLWDFGDGEISTSKDNPVVHKYAANNPYTVTLIATIGDCADTLIKPISVEGPIASFTMSDAEGCIGDKVTFTLGSTSGVIDYIWYPEGAGGPSATNVTPYEHTYSGHGEPYIPYVEVSGPSGSCTLYDTTVYIYRIDAHIGYNTEASSFCNQRNVYFLNQSNVADVSLWDLGNGNTSNDNDPIQAYDEGSYTVKLKVTNAYGCSDSTLENITIYSIPNIVVGKDTTICQGDSAQLWASGGHIIDWRTNNGIRDRYSYAINASPANTYEYSPIVTDTITDCASIAGGEAIQIVTVIHPPSIEFEISPKTDTLYNGESVTIRTDSNPNFNYLWSPDEYISCISCANPTITPIEEGIYEYFVLVSDFFNCGSVEDTVEITVEELYTIGISEAFTPNGDGVNDYIMVDGYGVKDLKEFSVYNRWGNKVFSTSDLDDIGWDGTIDGKKQSIDSYSYYIKAEMLNDSFIEKRGTLNLIR